MYWKITEPGNLGIMHAEHRDWLAVFGQLVDQVTCRPRVE